jgi:arsenate reductase
LFVLAVRVEEFTRHYYSDLFEIYSAGTKPEEKVNLTAIEVMKEIGIDMSKQVPKTLDEISKEADILIKMVVILFIRLCLVRLKRVGE